MREVISDFISDFLNVRFKNNYMREDISDFISDFFNA